MHHKHTNNQQEQLTEMWVEAYVFLLIVVHATSSKNIYRESQWCRADWFTNTLSSMVIHVDSEHLLINGWQILVYGTLVEPELGNWLPVLFVVGHYIGLLFHGMTDSVRIGGSSMGIYTIISYLLLRRAASFQMNIGWKVVILETVLSQLYQLLFKSIDKIAHIGHLGGAVCGAVVACWFCKGMMIQETTQVNMTNTLVFGTIGFIVSVIIRETREKHEINLQMNETLIWLSRQKDKLQPCSSS